MDIHAQYHMSLFLFETRGHVDRMGFKASLFNKSYMSIKKTTIKQEAVMEIAIWEIPRG